MEPKVLNLDKKVKLCFRTQTLIADYVIKDQMATEKVQASEQEKELIQVQWIITRPTSFWIEEKIQTFSNFFHNFDFSNF